MSGVVVSWRWWMDWLLPLRAGEPIRYGWFVVRDGLKVYEGSRDYPERIIGISTCHVSKGARMTRWNLARGQSAPWRSRTGFDARLLALARSRELPMGCEVKGEGKP